MAFIKRGEKYIEVTEKEIDVETLKTQILDLEEQKKYLASIDEQIEARKKIIAEFD